MVLIVPILVFVAMFVVTFALMNETAAARVALRLRTTQAGGAMVVPGSELDAELSKSLAKRLVFPKLARIAGGLVGFAPANYIRNARSRLEKAGYHTTEALTIYLVGKAVFAAGGVASAVVVPGLVPGDFPIKALAGFCGLALGLIAPDCILTSQIKSRQARIRRQLPDVLDLLVVSVEAGAGLDGAMTVALERKMGPLIDEFERFLSEVKFGRSRDRAWDGMQERVDLVELGMLIRAIQQADKMGVSIAKTLRNQAAAIRARRSQQVRVIAARMPIKLLFPLVLCIFPAMYVVLLAPGILQIYESFVLMPVVQ